MTFYHAIENASDGDIKSSYPTRRVPKNVPYVVDNLWAWTKPSQYADRRNSAYASPTPEQAGKFGDGDIYQVEVLGDSAVICQVIDPEIDDSKKHWDVTDSGVQKAVLGLLGKYDWTERPVDTKARAGRLFLPAVAPEEVNAILDDIGASENDRQALRDAVTYWDDVKILNDGDDVTDGGEIFFTYPDGYRLHAI